MHLSFDPCIMREYMSTDSSVNPPSLGSLQPANADLIEATLAENKRRLTEEVKTAFEALMPSAQSFPNEESVPKDQSGAFTWTETPDGIESAAAKVLRLIKGPLQIVIKRGVDDSNPNQGWFIEFRNKLYADPRGRAEIWLRDNGTHVVYFDNPSTHNGEPIEEPSRQAHWMAQFLEALREIAPRET